MQIAMQGYDQLPHCHRQIFALPHITIVTMMNGDRDGRDFPVGIDLEHSRAVSLVVPHREGPDIAH